MFDDDEREQMPLEAREIHQQLVNDSSQWARGLPADTRVAEFARTLPQRMPAPSAHPTRNVLAHRRPSSTLPDMMSVKGQPNMLKIEGSRRSIAASIAAVAVVALIVGVLYTMHNVQSTRAGSGGGHNNSTVVVPTPAQTPLPTPSSTSFVNMTMGPMGEYAKMLYYGKSLTAEGVPTEKTPLRAGDTIYIGVGIKGLPTGTHVVSIRWYLNGTYIDSPATSKSIDGDKLVAFGLKYPTAGVGMAKIYIDRPASDTSESSNDPYLACTAEFSVTAS